MQTTLPRYIVHCHTCRLAFDALAAAWCDCVTKSRSLVCPHCSRCFCDAPAVYGRTFWGDAPPSMWERRTQYRESQVRPRPSPPSATPRIRPLVLVVDDDTDVLAIASGSVAELGYGVLAASSAEEALDLARQYQPDLVLTDALMPKIDGREMCRRIKNTPELAATRVIIMSAVYKSSRYLTEATRTFGADGFVVKPLKLENLHRVLRTHLPAPLRGDAP